MARTDYHKIHRPTVGLWFGDLGFDTSVPEATLSPKHGERADRWGICHRTRTEWRVDANGEEQTLWAGDTGKAEFKWFINDVKQDPHKECRSGNRWPLADWWFLFLHEQGEAQPQHVDPELWFGWFIILFNEAGFRVVEPGVRNSRVSHGREKLMILKYARNLQANHGGFAESERGAPPVAGIIEPEPLSGITALLVATIQSEPGIRTKDMLRKHHIASTKADSIVKKLERTGLVEQPGGAGGGWFPVKAQLRMAT